MAQLRGALGIWSTILLLSACTAGEAPATEALVGTSAAAGSPTTNAATPVTESHSPLLIPAGCAVFDSEDLGALTPIGNPLAQVESRSEPENLTCNYVGTADGLDTGVRIEIDLLTSHADGHFTTADQLESPITVAGKQGVGTGRGTLRVQLDEIRGMTLAVTIRAISSAGAIPRDGEYLDIRDTIAAYVISALN